MGKDIHVVSMGVEAIAVIKKNPFVFGLIIFFSCLSKVMDGMYNIINDIELFILETA
jgi:hypothetical protein